MINFILRILQLFLWVVLGLSIGGIIIFTISLNPIAFVFLAAIWVLDYFLVLIDVVITDREVITNERT